MEELSSDRERSWECSLSSVVRKLVCLELLRCRHSCGESLEVDVMGQVGAIWASGSHCHTHQKITRVIVV